MNWWVKCISISMLIAKTASRNVAFKATRMRDSIMEGQDKFLMRKSDNSDVDWREDCEEDLADVGYNADLYVVNQETTDLIREVHMGDVSFSLNGNGFRLSQDLFHFQPLSLD